MLAAMLINAPLTPQERETKAVHFKCDKLQETLNSHNCWDHTYNDYKFPYANVSEEDV